MPLLRGEELEQVICHLEQRGVHLYHACQLRDFRAYLKLAGIPSRQVMEESGLPYTSFVTDTADHQNGVWSKVFGNLSDFGFGFARAEWRRQDTAPIPNPYGPILLEMRPAVLREADDLAVCLRSAGGNQFDRDAESLGTLADVARLFVNEFDPNERYANTHVKYSDALRQEFADRVKPATVAGWGTLNPELSCTVGIGRLSFAKLYRVVVDKYETNDLALADVVTRDMRAAGIQAPVLLREYRPAGGRERILGDLTRVLSARPMTIDAFLAAADLSEEALEWGRRVLRGNLGWMFERFATYLHGGTLAALRQEPATAECVNGPRSCDQRQDPPTSGKPIDPGPSRTLAARVPAAPPPSPPPMGRSVSDALRLAGTQDVCESSGHEWNVRTCTTPDCPATRHTLLTCRCLRCGATKRGWCCG